MHYIHIKNHQVIVNGELVFQGNSSALFNTFLNDLYKHSGISYPKFHKMDALCKLGILASDFLLQASPLTSMVALNKIGIVLSNAASSIDTDRLHQLSISDKANYFPSPAVFVYTLPNIVIGEIAIKHKITGENAFLISEKFEASLLVNYAHSLLSSCSDAVITGWLETNGEKHEAFLFMIEKGEKCDVSLINNLYQA